MLAHPPLSLERSKVFFEEGAVHMRGCLCRGRVGAGVHGHAARWNSCRRRGARGAYTTAPLAYGHDLGIHSTRTHAHRTHNRKATAHSLAAATPSHPINASGGDQHSKGKSKELRE
jgi:hypothetical protein